MRPKGIDTVELTRRPEIWAIEQGAAIQGKENPEGLYNVTDRYYPNGPEVDGSLTIGHYTKSFKTNQPAFDVTPENRAEVLEMAETALAGGTLRRVFNTLTGIDSAAKEIVASLTHLDNVDAQAAQDPGQDI